MIKALLQKKAITVSTVIIILIAALAIIVPIVSPFDATRHDLSQRLLAPGGTHLFGTDELGRDVFTRLFLATRVSIVTALKEKQLRKKCGLDIAMIFQEPMTSLNPLMRIGDQIKEALTIHGLEKDHRKAKEKVIQMLDKVGIPQPELRYDSFPHDLSVVRFIADRVCVMKDGKICELADADRLYGNPSHEYTKYLLSSVPDMSRIRLDR